MAAGIHMHWNFKFGGSRCALCQPLRHCPGAGSGEKHNMLPDSSKEKEIGSDLQSFTHQIQTTLWGPKHRQVVSMDVTGAYDLTLHIMRAKDSLGF